MRMSQFWASEPAAEALRGLSFAEFDTPVDFSRNDLVQVNDFVL